MLSCKTAGNAQKNKAEITTVLDLMKFLGDNINYPYSAQKSNIADNVVMIIEFDELGNVQAFSQESNNNNICQSDEITIIGYGGGKVAENDKRYHHLFVKESKRAIKKIPKVEIDSLKNCSLKLKFNFILTQ